METPSFPPSPSCSDLAPRMVRFLLAPLSGTWRGPGQGRPSAGLRGPQLGPSRPQLFAFRGSSGLEPRRCEFLSKFAQGSNFWKSSALKATSTGFPELERPERACPEPVRQFQSWRSPLTNMDGVPVTCQAQCWAHSRLCVATFKAAGVMDTLTRKPIVFICFLF